MSDSQDPIARVHELINRFRISTGDQSDIEFWQRATHELAKLGEIALPSLLQALKDENWNVRAWAADALGDLNDKQAVIPLVELLADSNRQVRIEATVSLGKLGDQRAVGALLKLLDTQDRVRLHAIRALGRLAGTGVYESLAKAIHDQDVDIRRAALFALGDLGDPRGLRPLLAALQDSDSEIRSAAALALGTLGDERALTALEHVQKYDDGKQGGVNAVRDFAAEGIKRIREGKSKSTTFRA